MQRKKNLFFHNSFVYIYLEWWMLCSFVDSLTWSINTWISIQNRGTLEAVFWDNGLMVALLQYFWFLVGKLKGPKTWLSHVDCCVGNWNCLHYQFPYFICIEQKCPWHPAPSIFVKTKEIFTVDWCFVHIRCTACKTTYILIIDLLHFQCYFKLDYMQLDDALCFTCVFKSLTSPLYDVA